MKRVDGHRPHRDGVEADDLRIERPRDIARGEPLGMVVDGRPLAAFQGESVAAALLASGRRSFRLSAHRGEPRGLFCGIGICYECLLIIDGIPNQRACMTPARPGMNVQTQAGRGIAPNVDGTGG
jgi:predicted molibdopterin-dependent oxidoreductase YjgC